MVAFIDVLFWFSSIYIFPFWLMMWFAPTHERTAALMRNEWVYLAPLAAAYTLAVLPNLVDILVLLGSDMPSPDIVVEMFSEREVILIGWLHYLAFDLFVGRWTWQRLVATGKPLYVGSSPHMSRSLKRTTCCRSTILKPSTVSRFTTW